MRRAGGSGPHNRKAQAHAHDSIRHLRHGHAATADALHRIGRHCRYRGKAVLTPSWPIAQQENRRIAATSMVQTPRPKMSVCEGIRSSSVEGIEAAWPSSQTGVRYEAVASRRLRSVRGGALQCGTVVAFCSPQIEFNSDGHHSEPNVSRITLPERYPRSRAMSDSASPARTRSHASSIFAFTKGSYSNVYRFFFPGIGTGMMPLGSLSTSWSGRDASRHSATWFASGTTHARLPLSLTRPKS